MMKNDSDSAIWRELFEREASESVSVCRAFEYLRDGVKHYDVPQQCRALAVREMHSSNCENNTGKLILLIEGTVPAAPGDRIIYKNQIFELNSVEECRDLGGRIIARRCSVK